MEVEDGVLLLTVRIQIEGELDRSDGDHHAVSQEGHDPHALEQADEGTEPALRTVVLEPIGGGAVGAQVHRDVDDVEGGIGGNREADEGVEDGASALTEAINGVFQLATGGDVSPERDQVANNAVLRQLGVVVDSEVSHDAF